MALLAIGFQIKRNEFLEDSEIKYEFESVWRHSEVPSKLILKSIILAVATANDGSLVNVMIDEKSLKTVTQQLGSLEAPTATTKRPPESAKRQALVASMTLSPALPRHASETTLNEIPKTVSEPPKTPGTNLMSSAPLQQLQPLTNLMSSAPPQQLKPLTNLPASASPQQLKPLTNLASSAPSAPSKRENLIASATFTAMPSPSARPPQESVALKPTGGRAALMASVSTPTPMLPAKFVEEVKIPDPEKTEKNADDLFNDLESELDNLKF